jgi:hypothetical protein
MPPDSISWPRRLFRWLPFSLPPLALALVIWLQPEDHMGPHPDRAPWVGRLVYDDWDWSAIVLRGLNAGMGRKAGLTEPPHPSDEEFCKGLDDPERALNDRYYLEYPQAATLFFRLPYLVRPVDAPAALCDGHYGNILEHQPRNDAERALWRGFRQTMQVYAACMVVCLLLLMAIVRVGYEPGGGLSGPVWLLVLPGALYFTLNRFDVLPALLTALSLACLGRRWLIASAALLAAATLIKVYPVLLAPLVFHYLWTDRRAALAWAGAFGVAAAAMVVPPLLADDWQAIAGPYQIQLTREPMGPTFYGRILPEVLEENDALGRGFRFGSLALVMAALCLTRPPDLASVLRRGAIAVIVFAGLTVFYSPQWILWFSPLLVPLAGRSWSVLLLVVALDIATYLTFPVVMDRSYADWTWVVDYRETFDTVWPLLAGALTYIRFALFATLVAVLGWRELRRTVTKSAAAVA